MLATNAQSWPKLLAKPTDSGCLGVGPRKSYIKKIIVIIKDDSLAY